MHSKCMLCINIKNFLQVRIMGKCNSNNQVSIPSSTSMCWLFCLLERVGYTDFHVHRVQWDQIRMVLEKSLPYFCKQDLLG